jgi:GrpB-like predicted nucleotidyltransferase (UPF0157 family)
MACGMDIGLYSVTVADFSAYDSASPEVAALVTGIILDSCPGVRVEHIGSTAVPGCAGRGIIDLLVLQKAGSLEEPRDALDNLGFQRQGCTEPFPEMRPMHVGAVECRGRTYSIHVHVVEADSAEARDLIKFRDLLRGSVGLRLAYEMEKRGILARGTRRGQQYAKAKSDFISHVLNADRF